MICWIESVDPVADLCLTNQIYSVLLNTFEFKEITEVTQNINTILYDRTLSDLQINMLTTYMNVNFNKMLETLIFQRSYAQYLY